LIDSQSVKTLCEGEERGFHGGKKIKGRSRQLSTDTEGNIWDVHVHAANRADTREGCVVAYRRLGKLPGVKAICADQGYRGTFARYVREIWNREVHFTSREGKGFAIEPKRWVVERIFGWFNGQRRLGKDHEKLTENSETMIYIAAIARSLRNPIFN